MRTLIATLLSLACLSAPSRAADSSCGSFRAPVDPPPLELAPPAGFVEICGQDEALCKKVSSGYSPTARTVGYFVTSQEWDQYRAGSLKEFSRYLVAQTSAGTGPAQFPEVREFIRSRRGKAPGDPKLPPKFDADGRAIIGVFEDTDDAIASGVIQKLKRSNATPPTEVVFAAMNIAFLTKNRLLSLYTYVDVTAKPSAEPAVQLSRDWLKCLRKAQ